MNFINLVDLIQVFANEYSQPASNVLLIGNSNIHGIFNFLNSDLIVVDNIPDPNVDLVIGSKHLPFIKESFDLIICIHNTFEINEIYRVLKPGGKILINGLFNGALEKYNIGSITFSVILSNLKNR